MKNIFCLFLLLAAIPANAQWIQTEGPYGGDISWMVSNAGTVYAGVNGGAGVSKTTNNGALWNRVFTNIPSVVTCLAFSGNNIYAGTFSGVYMSTNNGAVWSPIGLSDKHILCIAYSGGNIMVGYIGLGIYVSTNYGTNWTRNFTETGGDIINTFTASGSYVFAGSSNSFYRSANNGVNWVMANTGLISPPEIKKIVVSGAYLFIAANNGVYKSQDYGNNWSLISSNFPAYSSIYDIEVSGSIIYAGLDSGIYVTTNNGNNWTARNTGLISKYVNCLSLSGGNVLAGTDIGIFSSSDNGLNWSDANQNLKCQNIRTLINNGTDIMAGTYGYGVYFSSNGGSNWLQKNNGLNDLYILSLAKSQQYIFAGTTRKGIYRSSDNGSSWEQSVSGMPASADVIKLYVSGNDIYAGLITSAYSTGGLYRSTNNGTNWSLFAFQDTSVYDVLISGGNIYAAPLYGIKMSSNNGVSWSSLGLDDHQIKSVAVSGSSIIAGSIGGIYTTTNSGQNWSLFQLNSINLVPDLMVSGNYVLAATTTGILLSKNNGINWVDKNEGFLIQSDVNKLISAGDNVYAGTYYQSVWRRSFSEIIGIERIGTAVPEKYVLMQNYPNPFNPSTKIKFSVPGNGNGFVNLKVYDISGREVAELINGRLRPGEYEVTFDGGHLPSGVYFCRLTAGMYSGVIKMLLVK